MIYSFTIKLYNYAKFNQIAYCRKKWYQYLTVFQSIIIMKRFQNTRKRLVINRASYPVTPPKSSIQNIANVNPTIIHTPLNQLDCNLLKLNAPSLKKKESEQQVLLRCRSISCFEENRQSPYQASLLNRLPSLQVNKREKDLGSCFRFAVLNFQISLKQRGFLLSKNKSYCIPKNTLHDLLFDYGVKIKEDLEKGQNTNFQENWSSKEQSSQQTSKFKSSQSFSLLSQFSISQKGKSKILSLQSRNVNVQFEGQTNLFRQFFVNIVDTLQLHPKEVYFCSITDKLKYLQEEIILREKKIQQLKQELQSLSVKIQERKMKVEQVKLEVVKQRDILENVKNQVHEIQVFVLKQPNRILKQQAEGYKQRQQELFDLAFQLEQSSIQSVDFYVDEYIMIPFESFKLTLHTFQNESHKEIDHYFIPDKQMKAFCHSIRAIYASTIEKLKGIISTKVLKIKKFVETMRRLASYTIGKREYLVDINKKMASASTLAHERLIKIKQQFPSLKNVIEDLQELFEGMKNIYCQAEVFY